MADHTPSQHFSKTLDKLEFLADAQAKLPLGDRNKLDGLINEEIETILEASKGNARMGNPLEYHHRLIVVSTKLDESESKFLRKELGVVIDNVVCAETLSNDASVHSAFSTKLKSWSVPIVSCIYKPSHWHQKKYRTPLTFDFDDETGDFMIRAGEALAEFVDWTPDTGNDIETRFVVVSMLGHHHYVRLIPVSVNTGRREKVCDIKLGGEEHAQALKGHLLKMGFTAVVPPESDSAFKVGPETTLLDLAARALDLEH